MLNKNKRLLMGAGAIVGTAGIVTAIAVPLALRNKEEGTAGQTIDLTGTSLSAKDQAVKDTATAMATKVLGTGTPTVTSVTQAGNQVITSGTVTTVRRKRAAVSTATTKEFTITLTMGATSADSKLLLVVIDEDGKVTKTDKTSALATVTAELTAFQLALATATAPVTPPAAVIPTPDAGTGTDAGNTGSGSGTVQPPVAHATYTVDGHAYASMAEAQTAVDGLLEAQKVFVFNGTEYATMAEAQDAAFAAAAKDVKAINTPTPALTAAADGSFDISGIAAAATKDAWQYGTKVYDTLAKAQAAWLADNQIKTHAIKGQGTAAVTVGAQTATITLPEWDHGSTPVAGDITLTWEKTTTGTSTYVAGNNGGTKEVVTFTPKAGVTLDVTTHTYATAGPQTAPTAISFTETQAGVQTSNGTQEVISITGATPATHTFTAAAANIAAADLTLSDFKAVDTPAPTKRAAVLNEDPITTLDADASAEDGDAPAADPAGGSAAPAVVATTKDVTFTIDGQAFAITVDADKATEEEIKKLITVDTPGVAPVTAATPTKATFTFDGVTITATKADGSPLTSSDVTAAVSTPGVAAIAHADETAVDTYTLKNGSDATSITVDVPYVAGVAGSKPATVPTVTINVSRPAAEAVQNVAADAVGVKTLKIVSTTVIDPTNGTDYDASMLPHGVDTYHFLGTDETKAFVDETALKTFYKAQPANAITATDAAAKVQLKTDATTKYDTKAKAYEALITTGTSARSAVETIYA